MLILTKRARETIRIADNVTVTVLDVKGNQVRIGIKASEDVNSLREELVKRDRKAGEAS